MGTNCNPLDIETAGGIQKVNCANVGASVAEASTMYGTDNMTMLMAGVAIDSGPLHAIQIAPGLKFIGNLPHGWEPYIGVQMVWNIMDETKFSAANVNLPELSTRPYFQYGIGVQKRWGDRFTGFGQVMMRNGGRTGVALSAGFRWALGKGSNNKAKSYVPQRQKAQMNLSSVK